MAPETLERQLSPALEQLSRFWTLRRSPWVEEARRGIRAVDKQTAQLLQQKTALSSDLERHRAILSQLQSAQQQLQAERDELDARHQALTQTHARQGSALKNEQIAHHALQLAHAALKHEAAETRRQLVAAIDECKMQQAALAELSGIRQQLLSDLRQHQECLEQETASRVSLFQEKTALARQHEILTAQHENLFAVHQAAMEEMYAMADLLGSAPGYVTDEGASLVSKISALLERESLVRSVLGAPTRGC